MYLSVKNMNYKVPVADGFKTILNDFNFYLKPGMMTLVLGAPGGGRSSLFKVRNLLLRVRVLTLVEGSRRFCS